MSRKLTLLAVLNVLGWVIAVPLLLFAVVDPFVEFPGLPGRLGSGSAGTVHLDGPVPGLARAGTRTPRRDDPVRAAREALARFAPGSAGTLALVPGLVTGGGATARDRAELVAELRSRAGRTRPLGSPPASRGLASPPAPVVAPPGPGTPGSAPAVAPAPAPVSEDTFRPPRAEPPPPETAQAPESPPGRPEGQDSAPPPAEAPGPVPEPPAAPGPPGGEPQAPGTPPPPDGEPGETPAPETPAPPQDPPEDPGHKHPIPAAVEPPHEDVPHPDAPGESGPGNC